MPKVSLALESQTESTSPTERTPGCPLTTHLIKGRVYNGPVLPPTRSHVRAQCGVPPPPPTHPSQHCHRISLFSLCGIVRRRSLVLRRRIPLIKTEGGWGVCQESKARRQKLLPLPSNCRQGQRMSGYAPLRGEGGQRGRRHFMGGFCSEACCVCHPAAHNFCCTVTKMKYK